MHGGNAICLGGMPKPSILRHVCVCVATLQIRDWLSVLSFQVGKARPAAQLDMGNLPTMAQLFQLYIKVKANAAQLLAGHLQEQNPMSSATAIALRWVRHAYGDARLAQCFVLLEPITALA
jgi:hypothetical protein